MKPGIKTTEFWLALIASIIGGLMTVGVFAPGSTAAKILGACAYCPSSFGYSLARGQAKSAYADSPDSASDGTGGTFDAQSTGPTGTNLNSWIVWIGCTGLLVSMAGGCKSDNASSLYAKAATSEQLVLQAVITYDSVATTLGTSQAEKTAVLSKAKIGTDALAVITDTLKVNSDAYMTATAAGNDAAAEAATNKARIAFDAANAVATKLLADLKTRDSP